MIHNYVETMAQDLALLLAAVDVPCYSKGEQEKVKHAALRVFASFGMAFSVAKGVQAVVSESGFNLSKLSRAVGLYALSHDVFVVSQNTEKGMWGDARAGFTFAFNRSKEAMSGRKNGFPPTPHPFAEGTFCNPLWSAYFSSKQ